MKVTEEFLSGLIMELHGTYVVKYHPDGPGTERVRTSAWASASLFFGSLPHC
jgi:hypothetical protein